MLQRKDFIFLEGIFMNKIIVCTLLFAAASLLAEAPTSLNEQVENKQETVAPKVESASPAPLKKAPKTKALSVQSPVSTPQIKEEVVVAEKTGLEQDTRFPEALKEPTPQAQKVDPLTQKIEALETRLQQLEAAKVSAQPAAPIAMEEPAKEEAAALQISEPVSAASEVTPVTAQLSSMEEAPALQVEATEPAMEEPALSEPVQTTMDHSETQRTSMSAKKEEKLGSSRFANIAIGTASAAAVIVAAILGSN
jgi:hypothetical protein